jgi:hypothetical protein
VGEITAQEVANEVLRFVNGGYLSGGVELTLR